MAARFLLLLTVLLAAAAFNVAGCNRRPTELQSTGPGLSSGNRITLDNGITVLLYPVKGVEWVVVTPSYGTGFMDDPRGRPQMAHLLEHLACRCATKSYVPEQSFSLFQGKGDINAETLPDFTYYYYMVPPADLELTLRTEAERLTSLSITAEAIKAEAAKCQSEAGFVERAPRKMVGKFGLMALHQAWQHGLNRATVKSGMEDLSPTEMDAYRQSHHHPGNMTLVIMGGFDREKALAYIRDHLGKIKGQKKTGGSKRWAQSPKSLSVRWDVSTPAVVVGYLPPDDPLERVILSYYGLALTAKLMRDEKLQADCAGVECSNHLFSVGVLPFYVAAIPKPGVDLQRLERTLIDRVQSVLSRPPDAAEVGMLQSVAASDAQPSPITPDSLRQMAQMFQARMGMDARRAPGAALVQSSIDATRRERLLGPNVNDRLRAIQALTPATLHALLRRTSAPLRRFVTHLIATP
jgi:hypothetical protein